MSQVLKSIKASTDVSEAPCPEISIIALSYRGFWTSRGHPSQRGIELDAKAALHFVFNEYSPETTDFVIWGQSIGAGVATTGLASFLESETDPVRQKSIRGLLLETPFTDMRSMLVAMYPQKFLPYRYLWPFLQSSWDSKTALKRIAEAELPLFKVLLLQGSEDEIVPPEHAVQLEQICRNGHLDVERKAVSGALHTEVMTKPQGRKMIADFLRAILTAPPSEKSIS